MTLTDGTGAQVRGRAAMKVISSNVSVNGFKKKIVIEKTTFVQSLFIIVYYPFLLFLTLSCSLLIVVILYCFFNILLYSFSQFIIICIVVYYCLLSLIDACCNL